MFCTCSMIKSVITVELMARRYELTPKMAIEKAVIIASKFVSEKRLRNGGYGLIGSIITD